MLRVKKIKHLSKTQKKTAPRWFYIIIILIPIFFLLLLETGLRIFNYGNDFPVFINAAEDNPGKLLLNPELPAKYFFNLKKGPGVVPDAFDKIKKENAFRVFVLGESSAAGWPFIYNASFPANLRRRLELLYPENTIEIINCGISAINSYTIRDIVPDIIEKQPDLVLIYTGHNEYYGALGVGSSASLGKSRTLINTYLWVIKFKTTQLIADIVSGIASVFSSTDTEIDRTNPETLMSTMIEESLIPLNSELHNLGIEQFEDNFKDIIIMFKEENIPVIAGTLTCNTKDLRPFISVKYDNYPPAQVIYENAKKEYEEGNIKEAEELFLYAKELDALKFRAPEKINEIIKETAEEFYYNVVDIDSVFKASSPDGIVGYNLTVDHLHPSVEGHHLIAESFFFEMEKRELLPGGRKENLTKNLQDSIMKADFPFTTLDSVIAFLRTIQLTGAYPFISKDQPNTLMMNFHPENYIDSTALKVLTQRISWGEAHIDAAMHFYSQGRYDKFLKEMDAVIEARPFYDKLYEQTINALIEVNLLNEAAPYLKKLHSLNSSFFTAKWLGQIALQKKNYKEAEEFLEKSLSYSDKDYQVWYNLAGIYYNKNEFEKSYSAIERSLAINPDYPYAKNVYRKLKSLLHKQ